MNVHLLHHWLVSMRGGEKVLEQFCKLFPNAPVHTLVHTKNEKALCKSIRQHTIDPTILNLLPGADRHYKLLLPFFPMAIKNHVVEADFILSSDAGLIKGMRNANDAPHVCYCHSPPRYLWDLQPDYLEKMSLYKRTMLKKITPYLRSFDQKSVEGVDHFIANSVFVQKRIKRIYGRESTVIHPPVDLSSFSYEHPSEGYYLVVSALVPYKKVKLAVEAFNRMKKPLVVIGDGSERSKLETAADGNITFLGAQPTHTVRHYFERCKALIFPGVEDFGITPLEAQASGKPVIAYRKGGALETVVEKKTGIFFDNQTVDDLIEAVHYFAESNCQYTPRACRKQSEKFSTDRFQERIKSFLRSKYPARFSSFKWGS